MEELVPFKNRALNGFCLSRLVFISPLSPFSSALSSSPEFSINPLSGAHQCHYVLLSFYVLVYINECSARQAGAWPFTMSTLTLSKHCVFKEKHGHHGHGKCSVQFTINWRNPCPSIFFWSQIFSLSTHDLHGWLIKIKKQKVKRSLSYLHSECLLSCQ